jgi:hypothetical protein
MNRYRIMKCIAWLILGMLGAVPALFGYVALCKHFGWAFELTRAAWVQIAIVIGTGLTAFMIASKSRPVRRVGFAIGVCTQPFWFMASYWSGQWGVCLTCFWYVICHARGFVNTKN